MTSIEWLIEEMLSKGFFKESVTLTNIDHLQYKAEEMHKQEIIDAHKNGEYLIPHSENAELYYQETFVSKGSGDTLKDYHIVDTNEMVYQVPDIRKMEEDDDININ
jgi:hypothetical protein